MSSDEDDYMSDKILQACTSTNKGKDLRPGLIHNHSRQREHEIAAKKARLDEDNKKKHQPALRLQEGLNTSLSSSNKGFAMLQKMGYKEGQALGKSESGIVVPITVQVKNDRGGLGRDAAIKEIQEYRAQARLKRLNKGDEVEKITPEEYRRQMALKSQTKQIDFDLIKAQKACAGLDRDLNVQYPVMKWFWPENRLPVDPDEEKSSEDEEKEAEQEKYDSSEKLEMLTRYLRSCYFYCIYCGIKYENATDFQTNCPGTSRDDH